MYNVLCINTKFQQVFTLPGSETRTETRNEWVAWNCVKLSHYTWTRTGAEAHCSSLLCSGTCTCTGSDSAQFEYTIKVCLHIMSPCSCPSKFQHCVNGDGDFMGPEAILTLSICSSLKHCWRLVVTLTDTGTVTLPGVGSPVRRTLEYNF